MDVDSSDLESAPMEGQVSAEVQTVAQQVQTVFQQVQVPAQQVQTVVQQVQAPVQQMQVPVQQVQAAVQQMQVPVQQVQAAVQQMQVPVQQVQQGTSMEPLLQQLISSSVQKPQMVTGSPKLQQFIVANPQQSNTTSSALQQIISAAVQPDSQGAPQMQRIMTTQGIITASQLQQMITSNPQLQQGGSRLQQIIVTSSQLQSIVGQQQQLQRNLGGSPQVQKFVTTSTPILQGVIASTQVQSGVQTTGQVIQPTQVLQGVRTISQVPQTKSSVSIQSGKSVGTQQTQQITRQVITNQGIKQTVSTQAAQPIKTTVSGLLQQGVRPTISTQSQVQTKTTLSQNSPNLVRVTASPQLQQMVKTAVTSQGQQQVRSNVIQQQITKPTTPQAIQPNVKQQTQVIKTTGTQQIMKSTQQGVKTVQQVQQYSKAPPPLVSTSSPVQQQTVKTVSQGVSTSTSTQNTVKSQGVVATPRLQQMVSTPPKKPKEEKPKKPTNLGELIGKLSHGSRHVKRFKEDRRNIAKAIKPLNYGAFGSYAPSYDSSFANLSKDESDLINGSYTDFEPSDHIKSIISKDYDYTFTFADNLVDMLSGGTSSKKMKLEKEEEADAEFVEAVETVAPKTEQEEVDTLSALGIDLTHLPGLQEAMAQYSEGSPEIQQKLEYTTGLLKRLQQAQYDRLSVPPHPRLGHAIVPPSDSEFNLATEITGNLAELARQVPPGALVVDRVCTLK